MVYYKDNQWNISNTKVRFKDGTEETTKSIGSEGKAWWEELFQKHKEIKLVEYIEISETPEQLNRLEEVNKLSIEDGFSEVVGNYVINNEFPDLPNHILKDLQFTKMFNIMLGVE